MDLQTLTGYVAPANLLFLIRHRLLAVETRLDVLELQCKASAASSSSDAHKQQLLVTPDSDVSDIRPMPSGDQMAGSTPTPIVKEFKSIHERLDKLELSSHTYIAGKYV